MGVEIGTSKTLPPRRRLGGPSRLPKSGIDISRSADEKKIGTRCVLSTDIMSGRREMNEGRTHSKAALSACLMNSGKDSVKFLTSVRARTTRKSWSQTSVTSRAH